jgi:hypothetical protein
MRSKTFCRLGLVLIISVLLRLGVALYLGDGVDAPALLTDQRSYHALGARLLAGEGYSFAQGWFPSPRPIRPPLNITLLPPLDYLTLIHLMKHSTLILADSGGIQEESPSWGCWYGATGDNRAA